MKELATTRRGEASRRERAPLHPIWLGAATVSLLACVGTSAVPPQQAPPSKIEPQPTSTAPADTPKPSLKLSLLSGSRWRAEGKGGPAGGWHLSYRFDGDRYTTDGYPAWQESGHLTQLEGNAQRMRLRFSERIFDGTPDADVERWLIVAADQQSFTMNGNTFIRQPHAAQVATDPEDD